MIAIVIPTYNEAKNIPELISRIDRVMSNADLGDYQVLVMDDDSPDGTSRLVNDLGLKRVKSINRKGKARGLANAVLDGFKETNADIVGVMDADLSHPPELLPELIRAVKDEGYNVALGSRYVPGGGVKNWPLLRQFYSRAAAIVAHLVTPVKDSGSGFFMAKKAMVKEGIINPMGFKVVLEVLVKANHENKIKEVPFVFQDRRRGESKLSNKVVLLYFQQIWSLCLSKYFNKK